MAEKQTRPVLQFSAGGLVVDERGRVLLIRARDLRNQPVWTLPKGTLGPGESSADAALREVREETGYRCEVVRELDTATYWFQRDGQRIRKTVRWFLMRPLEPRDFVHLLVVLAALPRRPPAEPAHRLPPPLPAALNPARRAAPLPPALRAAPRLP